MMTAKRFKMIRSRLGLTMEEVARFLGVTKGSVSLLESGKRRISGPVERLMLLLENSNGDLRAENPWTVNK